MKDLFLDEDTGHYWVLRNGETDRRVQAERRPGESWDDCFNRLLREGIARELARMMPAERARYDAMDAA